MTTPVVTRTALLLALGQGPGYGLELIGRVRDRTGGRVRLAESRVYPALLDLAQAGMVTATQVTPGARRGGRARTYYELTPAGFAAAEEDRSALALLVAGPARRPVNRGQLRRMASRLVEMDALSELAGELRAAMLRRATRARHGRR
jgi:DNA-binding PadR family transcriptional regulator